MNGDATGEGKKEVGGGGGASWRSDVTSVVFCVVLCVAVALPLGLCPHAALVMAIQVVVWLPSALAKSEKFYDITGMWSFIALMLFSQALSLSNAKATAVEEDVSGWGERLSNGISYLFEGGVGCWPWRHFLATSLVLIWALRLGTFLFSRMQKEGHDSRFNKVRDRPLKFLLYWCIQGVWVFLTPLPVLALHKTLREDVSGDGCYATEVISLVDVVGIVVWVLGLVIEVVADEEKMSFRLDKANAGKFIDTGLWSHCRHPNYFGEMVLWFGMFIFCARGVLGTRGGWMAILGPLFVVAIMVFMSTPLLEVNADKKYGSIAAYQEYKRRTPSLVPRFRV